MLLCKVQPGPVPKYRSFCLSVRDTVCPSGGGGSNTTHALLSPDPETLSIGGVSRPATGEFLETKILQGRRTVAPYAPTTAGSNSTLSQRYGSAIIP